MLANGTTTDGEFNMGWIGDVVPRTTIRSVWGNEIRDQVVQIFDNTGDWDHAPIQQPGMFGFSAQNNEFVYRDNTGWHWLYDYHAGVQVGAIQDAPVGAQIKMAAGKVYALTDTNGAAYVAFPNGFAFGMHLSCVLTAAQYTGSGLFLEVDQMLANGFRMRAHNNLGANYYGYVWVNYVSIGAI